MMKTNSVPEQITLFPPGMGIVRGKKNKAAPMVKNNRADRTVKNKHASRDLKGWFGGAGGDGTYQALINLIPPHEIYISLFAGKCAVRRFIRAAASTYVFDLDERIIAFWKQWKEQKHHNHGAFFSIENRNAFEVLDSPWLTTASWHNNTFIFVDPPFPNQVRKSPHRNRYKYEITDADHVQLCRVLDKDYKECKIMIRTIENPIYNKHLKGWHKVYYTNTTRTGQVQECVYLNYPPPDELHDYSFLGKDYEDRRRIKVKIRTHVNRLKRLPAKERNAIIKAIEDYKKILNYK